MFSVLQTSTYTVQIISQRNCINCLDSVTGRNNSEKLNESCRSVHYKEGTEFSGSGFADYYDLNWLSNNDNVQIVYVDNDTPTRDRIKFIDHGVGLVVKDLSTTSP
jgi:hypothetical protein